MLKVTAFSWHDARLEAWPRRPNPVTSVAPWAPEIWQALKLSPHHNYLVKGRHVMRYTLFRKRQRVFLTMFHHQLGSRPVEASHRIHRGFVCFLNCVCVCVQKIKKNNTWTFWMNSLRLGSNMLVMKSKRVDPTPKSFAKLPGSIQITFYQTLQIVLFHGFFITFETLHVLPLN